MPIRHEDDYRRKPIASWDTWIEDEIRASQERGEFDNLPDAGKPIKLEDTPFAPDMASALRTLKNAGYEPTWMELDRKITQGKADLQTYLANSRAYLQDRMESLRNLTEQDENREHRRLPFWKRWWRVLRHGTDFDIPAERTFTLDDLVLIRAAMREQYLERAAVIDKLTVDFHAALPRYLWHLERLRITPEQASRTFDDAIPLPL